MGTYWHNQEEQRARAPRVHRTEAERQERVAQLRIAGAWALWIATAVLALAGVALGLDDHHDQGTALQIAGLTLAVCSWAYQEHGARRG